MNNILYYQPVNKEFLSTHSKRSVWHLDSNCKRDTGTDEISIYRQVDIEAPVFIDLQGFDTTKFIIESFLKQFEGVDGTDYELNYAFCIVEPRCINLTDIVKYLEGEGVIIEEADGLAELMENISQIKNEIVLYWNYD